jgi:hypothetical protein
MLRINEYRKLYDYRTIMLKQQLTGLTQSYCLANISILLNPFALLPDSTAKYAFLGNVETE